MDQNHRADDVMVNGPVPASVDGMAILAMKKSKRMKLEKVTRSVTVTGGQRMEVAAMQGTDPDGNVTRCICGFVHDDGYMICCDRCSVWQHVLCVCVNPSDPPENYLCDFCDPRQLDFGRATSLQRRKLEEMADLASTNSDDSADESGSVSPPDFSSKLCEGVVHDHLSSTCLTASSFAASGGMSRGKRKVRKTSISRSLRLQKAHSWDSGHSSLALFDPTQLQLVDFHGEQGKQVPVIADVDHQSQHSAVVIDPWDFRASHWNDKFDLVPGNKYTAEICNIVDIVVRNKLIVDLALEPPQTDPVHCMQHLQSTRWSLVCMASVDTNTFLHEYQGRFLTRGLFESEYGSVPWTNSLCPYTLFFKLANLDLCVDARLNGNISRFVRRSCTPNAKVRCYVQDGKLRVGIFSQCYMAAGTEITIPFDFDYRECNFIVECPCGMAVCSVQSANKQTQQRLQNAAYVAGETGMGGMVGIVCDGREVSVIEQQMMKVEQQTLPLGSPKKMNASGNHLRGPKRRRRRQSDGAILGRKEGDGDSDSMEFDGFEQEKKKNMTREERKLEAIMKAFEKMEKNEKRKRDTVGTGKCSGGASPEGEEKKPSGRGRKVGQVTKKKPGRKRRSLQGLSLESLSPDSSSNLTATPPATPVDIISPFTTPLMATPVHTPSGSSVKLPRKKFIVNKWLNQDRVVGSVFGSVSADMNASQPAVENRDREMNAVKENGTESQSDVLSNEGQSNHSVSNGITLEQEIKSEIPPCERTELQTSLYMDSPNPHLPTSTFQSDSLKLGASLSSFSPQLRSVDPRKALLNSWPATSMTTSTNQNASKTPSADVSALRTKKRWLQMARRATTTQAVTSSCPDTCSDTIRTETAASPPRLAASDSPSTSDALCVSVLDSVPAVSTSGSVSGVTLAVDMREQGGKGGKRKMSLLEYRNRKRDAVPKEGQVEKHATAWLSESLGSSFGGSVSAFGVTHTFPRASEFEMGERNEQWIPQPHTPPEPPVIEPVTPEGDESDQEDAMSRSPSREQRWEQELIRRDKSRNLLDWTSNPLSVLQPPRLPDLPPLPTTPPPPPPPLSEEAAHPTDIPPVTNQWAMSHFQPGWTTHQLLTFPSFQQQQVTGLTFVQPQSHTTSFSLYPPIGRTNFSMSDSTQYTLGVSPSSSLPSVNPNGPYYH